jgi:hypothetical protein
VDRRGIEVPGDGPWRLRLIEEDDATRHDQAAQRDRPSSAGPDREPAPPTAGRRPTSARRRPAPPRCRSGSPGGDGRHAAGRPRSSATRWLQRCQVHAAGRTRGPTPRCGHHRSAARSRRPLLAAPGAHAAAARR